MSAIKSTLVIIIFSGFFLGSCQKKEISRQSMIDDQAYLCIIQRYINHYPSLKGISAEQRKSNSILFYKCSISDTTRINVDRTCSFKEILTFGFLYAYLIDSVYVFSNFELFRNRKRTDFDSAAARGTEDYYQFIKEKMSGSYFIDCFPYKPLRITKFKGQIIKYEFSYGFLPQRYFIAIMKKKLTRDREAWYRKRIL
jgi:hypothetical protein